jgi:hypothetical protein
MGNHAGLEREQHDFRRVGADCILDRQYDAALPDTVILIGTPRVGRHGAYSTHLDTEWRYGDCFFAFL